MKQPEQIDLLVEGLTPQGDGLARHGFKEVSLAGTVPGDRVRAFVGRRKRHGRAVGRVEEFLEHGMARTEPACPHFGVCGGCRWQNIEYDQQLLLKHQMISAALTRAGSSAAVIQHVIESPDVFFYRNKMEFSFGRGFEGELQLGLHVRQRYNRVFNLEACQLQSELSNRTVRSVRDNASALQLAAYDLRRHEGLLRFLVVREAKSSAGLLVNLVVSAYPEGGVDELVSRVLSEVPEITDFVVTLHSGKAQVAIGEREHVVKGDGHIREKCGALEFEISPQSFFQTNTRQAARLYGLVEAMAPEAAGAEVVDVFCGTGGITLHLARHAAHVLGVEQVAEAVVDARRNAAWNGVSNCEFVAGKAEVALAELSSQGRTFDVVVVDPPRPGVHKEALKQMMRLQAPVIIYVSCNPYSMADDLGQLTSSGYSVETVQPIDLFPHTPHCEVVTRIVR